MPLHPKLVHFPIVFGALMPVVAIVALLYLRRHGERARGWIFVVGWAAMLAGFSFVAVETGQDQEDAVEDVVGRAELHEHEEAGEALRTAAVVMFFVSLVGLVPGRVGIAGRYAGAISSVVLLSISYRTGESGGELVYVHGAASAYSSPAVSDEMSPGAPEEEHEDEEPGGG